MVLLTRFLLWIFWLGLGVGRFICFFSGLVGSSLVPSCSLPVYFLEPLGSFVLYTVFLLIKKKKKNDPTLLVATIS